MFFGKQKFDVKPLKIKCIKSISDLIISTSNVTLEVTALHPSFATLFISGLFGDAISNFRLLDLDNASFN